MADAEYMPAFQDFVDSIDGIVHIHEVQSLEGAYLSDPEYLIDCVPPPFDTSLQTFSDKFC